MKAFFNVPLCHFYIEPRLGTEHTDEAFYGQWAEVTEEKGDFCHIRAEYGYEGYVKTNELFFGDYTPTHTVISGYADLLPKPENGLLAPLCIPRGACIQVLADGGNERYAAVKAVDGNVYYVHRRNIMTLKEKNRKRSEDEFRRGVYEIAKLYLGSGYRWGGKTVAGIDCSGLAFMSYYMNGVVLHRDAHFEKSPVLKEITFDEAKCGDLLFFPGHVAIYVGCGLFIHSTTALGGVGYNSFDKSSPIYNGGLRDTLLHTARYSPK